MKKILYLILIPLGIGIVVAIVEYLLPRFLQENAELSYTGAAPISYIDPQKVQNLDIKINGKDASYLFSNQIIIENSGALPIKEVPVSIVFETTDSLFQIYNYSHSTIPKYEFGYINHHNSKFSVKFTFNLLNPSDKVFINILTNKAVRPSVYAKSEGMKLFHASIEDTQQLSRLTPVNALITDIDSVFAVIVSLVSTVVAYLASRKGLRLSGRAEVMNDIIKDQLSDELKIISAIYGKGSNVVDVTDLLNERIKDNKLNEIANNNLGGDPCPGTIKELKILYSFRGKTEAIVFQEHDQITLPVF